MAISGRQLQFRRGCPVIGLGTARFPRRFAPRNDNSGAFTILTMPCTCCFNGGLYNLRVPSRDCHVASLLAMTNLKASCRRIIVPILAAANGAQGTPYRRQLVCAFLSLPCTSCKCLTPRFTRILRPAGGKNTALSGKTHIFPHVLRPKRRTMGGKPAKE